DHQDRRQEAVLDGRCIDLHRQQRRGDHQRPPSAVTRGCGSVTPTCCIMAWVDGSMIDSIGFGKKPSSRIISTSGAIASRSRPLSSVTFSWTSAGAGPVIVRWYMIRM